MDSNAQYYPFDSFQPPIADSLIRDGECKNGHESCLFRIIELYHGRFTLRKLSRWKQWECRPGDTDDWYVSIIICPFRFEPHSLKQCPSLPALFIHKNIFHPVFHRCISKLSTPPPPDLSIRILGWNAFIYQTYDVLCNFIVLHNVLKWNVSVIY